MRHKSSCFIWFDTLFSTPFDQYHKRIIGLISHFQYYIDITWVRNRTDLPIRPRSDHTTYQLNSTVICHVSEVSNFINKHIHVN
jgi:hypothetical protein